MGKLFKDTLNGHPVASPLLTHSPSPHLLPEASSRLLFFADKGGVGKTMASCVTAVWLARQGYKTLLLTTDPAAHSGDVLGVPVACETGTKETWRELAQWATGQLKARFGTAVTWSNSRG